MQSFLRSMLWISIASVFTSTPVTATEVDKDLMIEHAANWFLKVDLGLYKPSLPDTLTLRNRSTFANTFDFDQYTLRARKESMLALAVGKLWQNNNFWFPMYALGLRYQHFFDINVAKSITEYSLPMIDNYSYQWKIKSDAITMFTKINLLKIQSLLPYLQGGVGIAQNNSNNYSEQVISSITPRFSPVFGSNSMNQFTYNLGAGVDLLLSQHWLFTLGYEFQSLGKVYSGNGTGTWSREHLSLNTYNTNTGLIGMTYLIQ